MFARLRTKLPGLVAYLLVLRGYFEIAQRVICLNTKNQLNLVLPNLFNTMEVVVGCSVSYRRFVLEKAAQLRKKIHG